MNRPIAVFGTLTALCAICTGQVSGRVVMPDGKPAANAQVILSTADPVTRSYGRSVTVSDAEGRFVFPDAKEEYGNVASNVPGSSLGWAVVEPGRRHVRIRLGVYGERRGIAIDQNGKPIAGASVRVASLSTGVSIWSWGRWFSQPDPRLGLTAVSDAKGRFVIRGIAPTEWVALAAEKGNDLKTLPSNNWKTIRAGSEPRWLVLHAHATVQGLVLRNGVPEEGATVTASDQFQDTIPSPRSDHRGRFELRVQPGRHFLRVTSADGTWVSPAVAVEAVSAETSRVAFSLRQGTPVSGKLSGRGPFSGQMTVTVENDQAQYMAWLPVPVGADGSFTTSVLPGSYDMSFSNTTDHISRRITVGSEPLTLNLKAAPRMRQIPLRAVDTAGRPVRDAWVVNMSDTNFIFAGSTGATEPVPVVGGNGRLFGVAAPGPNDKEARVVLRPGRPVTGMVVDRKRRPIPGVNVGLLFNLPEIRWMAKRLGRTDANGKFRIFAPAGEPVRVVAQAEGFADQVLAAVPLREKDDTRVPNLVMVPLGRVITGRAVWAGTGKPVAGADIAAQWTRYSFSNGYAVATANGQTGPDGRFRITGVPADRPINVMPDTNDMSVRFHTAAVGSNAEVVLEIPQPGLTVQSTVLLGFEFHEPKGVRWLSDKPDFTNATVVFAAVANPASERELNRLKGTPNLVVVFDDALPIQEIQSYWSSLGIPGLAGVLVNAGPGFSKPAGRRLGVKELPSVLVLTNRIVTAVNPRSVSAQPQIGDKP
jgi:hypothetical protein